MVHQSWTKSAPCHRRTIHGYAIRPHIHIDASEPWFEHPKARRGPLPSGSRLSSGRGETRADGGAADFRGAVHSNQLALQMVGHVRMGSSRRGRSHINMGVCYGRSGTSISFDRGNALLFMHHYRDLLRNHHLSRLSRLPSMQHQICVLKQHTSASTWLQSTSPQSHLPHRRRPCRHPESPLPTRAHALGHPERSSAPACAGSWGSAWP